MFCDFLHEDVIIAFLVGCLLRLATMATMGEALLLYYIFYIGFVIEVWCVVDKICVEICMEGVC
jgi:hypothetical protein